MTTQAEVDYGRSKRATGSPWLLERKRGKLAEEPAGSDVRSPTCPSTDAERESESVSTHRAAVVDGHAPHPPTRSPEKNCRRSSDGERAEKPAGRLAERKQECRLLSGVGGNHERVQSSGARIRWGREIRADRPVRDGVLHREVRPHDRGLLQEGDRGGLVPVRAGDPGHGGDRAVRLHAGPVHQERPGFHPGLQPGEPAELPGHQADEGPDHPGEAVRAGADDPGGEQSGPGGGEGGVVRRGEGAGGRLELPVHGNFSQKQKLRGRTVRGDCPTDELCLHTEWRRPVLLVLCNSLRKTRTAIKFYSSLGFQFAMCVAASVYCGACLRQPWRKMKAGMLQGGRGGGRGSN